MPKLTVLFICALHFVFQVLGKKGNGQLSSNTTVRNYDLTLTSAYLAEHNPKYFGPDSVITVEGPNEYSYQINILKTLPADALSIYNTFERNSRDEYVPSISVRSTICGDYEKERKGVPFYKCLRNYEAGAKECPFKKGVYKLTKASCLPSDGPIMVPGRYWRINNTWVTTSNELLLRRIFEMTIQRKMKIG